MRILLDTHLVLWALGESSRLSRKARKRIEEAEIYVSAASIWEIGIKARLGKLDANPDDILAGIAPAGFAMLSITGEHAIKAAELPLLHKDPFDHMLVAQAHTEPMILLTNDTALASYGAFVSLV